MSDAEATPGSTPLAPTTVVAPQPNPYAKPRKGSALTHRRPVAPSWGSPAWVEGRRTGIGGSDMPAIMGLSPFMSGFELFMLKRGEILPKPMTEAMEWGHRHEPVILEAYRDRTGREVYKPRAQLRHAHHPFLIGNLDGITVEGDRVVECKAVMRTDAWGEPGTDQVPDHYAIQAQHYLLITGLPVCDIAALFNGNTLVIYTIHADADLHALFVDVARGFWEGVQNNRPPEITNMADARLRYGHLKPNHRMAATAQHIEWVARLKDARQHIEDVEAEESDLKCKLMLAMGEEADEIIGLDGKPLVSWKLAAPPNRLDIDRFRAEQPELFTAYRADTRPSRRFLVK